MKNIITPPSWKGVYYNIKNKNHLIQPLNKKWLNKIKKEFINIKKHKKFDFLQYRFTNINIIFSLFKINSIIDVGGSNAWSYFYLKNFSRKKNLKKFTILETKEVCKTMKLLNYEKIIKYEHNINNIRNHDFLYSNSTFQYILKDKDIKDIIKKTKPKYILLEDMMLGDFKDFYTEQIYYNITMIVKFRNQDKFNKLLKSLNYEIVYIENYISKHRGVFQKLPMEGFSNKNKIDYSKSIFAKLK